MEDQEPNNSNKSQDQHVQMGRFALERQPQVCQAPQNQPPPPQVVRRSQFKEQDFTIEFSRSISERAYKYTKLFFPEMNRFQAQEVLNFSAFTYNLSNKTPNRQCFKMIGKNKASPNAYRCKDCGLSYSSIICQECFFNSDHKDHQYEEYETNNGICDCGNYQSWSVQGSCNNHKPQQKALVIEPQIRQLYHKQIQLLFYLYFSVVYNIKKLLFDQIKVKILTKLSVHLIFISKDSLEMKSLCCEVMQKKFQGYLRLRCHGDSTILQHLFELLEWQDECFQLNDLFLLLFPIERMRELILINYFKKSRTNQFTDRHFLKNINFQYLTCLKITVRFINQGKMLPLGLSVNTPFDDTHKQEVLHVYTRFYEDLSVIYQIKDCKEYAKAHLALCSIRELFLYKDLGFDIDDNMLDTMVTIVPFVINEKHILRKVIKELFQQILFKNTFDFMIISRADERVLALFIFVYFEGKIEKLTNQNEVNEFKTIFNIPSENILQKVLNFNLRSLFQNPVVKRQRRDKKSSQMNLASFDSIYHKILIMLWPKQYGVVVKQIMSYSTHKTMFDTIKVIINLISCNLDQIQLASIFSLTPGRIRTSMSAISYIYKDSSVQKIIHIFKDIVHNKDYMEEFYKNNKENKIFDFAKSDVLHYFFYETYLKNSYDVNEEALLTTACYELLSPFYNHIFSQKAIQAFCQLSVQHSQAESYLIELVKLFMILKDNKIESAIKRKGKSQNLTSNKILQRTISFLFPQVKQSKYSSSIVQDSKSNKKRQIIERMRNNQQVTLKKFEQPAESPTKHEIKPCTYQFNSIQKQSCIYCRSQDQKDLHHHLKIDFTNMFQSILSEKSDEFHLTFSICPHKIHYSCYIQAVNFHQAKKCIACQKPISILLPILQTQVDIIKARQSLSILKRQIFSKYQNMKIPLKRQNRDQAFSLILIDSIVKQLIVQAVIQEANDHNFIKTYKTIIKIVISQTAPKIYPIINFLLNQLPQGETSFEEEYRFALGLLSQYIENSKVTDPKNQIPLNLRNILLYFKQIAFQTKEISLKQVKKHSLSQYLMKLPQNLRMFDSSRMRCQNCPTFQGLYSCLLCGWHTCLSHRPEIIAHSKMHLSGFIWINHKNGQLQQINFHAKERNTVYEKVQQKLYTNLYNQAYTYNRQSRLNYRLNIKNYKKVLEGICNHTYLKLVE